MTSDAARWASDNLTRTYFELGLAVPGAKAIEDEGFRACVGELDHPVCNFAVPMGLDPWAARRLRQLAGERPAFHVYRLPETRAAFEAELLAAAGFVRDYSLCVMASPGVPCQTFEVDRASVETRPVVARFMTEQFFLRQTPEFRRRIAEATASAKGLELYSVQSRSERSAAVMLCRGEGVCGLYNLCVASEYRRRGLGSALVKWVLGQAHSAGESVTLQCDATLEPWYRSLGFASCGKVEVFCLQRPA